jgi:hypothetical protein
MTIHLTWCLVLSFISKPIHILNQACFIMRKFTSLIVLFLYLPRHASGNSAGWCQPALPSPATAHAPPSAKLRSCQRVGSGAVCKMNHYVCVVISPNIKVQPTFTITLVLCGCPGQDFTAGHRRACTSGRPGSCSLFACNGRGIRRAAGKER